MIHEKSYDSIAVQEILNRANVGRSTFYTHFRDKDQLLVSNIHDLLDSARASGAESLDRRQRILSFSLPIFEHLDRHRRAGEGRMSSRGRAVLHERLRKVIAESIADDLGKDLQDNGMAADRIPPDLLVRYLTSTFVLVLDWWVQSKSRLAPVEANNLFQAMVLPTLHQDR